MGLGRWLKEECVRDGRYKAGTSRPGATCGERRAGVGSCVHFEGTKGVRVHEGWQAGRDAPAQLAPPITPVSHITLAS